MRTSNASSSLPVLAAYLVWPSSSRAKVSSASRNPGSRVQHDAHSERTIAMGSPLTFSS